MNIYILTMHALRGPLAVALESMLLGYGINTLDELVAVIRSGGHRLAEYMDSNECRRAAYAAMQQQLFVSRADAQTQTDKQPLLGVVPDLRAAHQMLSSWLVG